MAPRAVKNRPVEVSIIEGKLSGNNCSYNELIVGKKLGIFQISRTVNATLPPKQ